MSDADAEQFAERFLQHFGDRLIQDRLGRLYVEDEHRDRQGRLIELEGRAYTTTSHKVRWARRRPSARRVLELLKESVPPQVVYHTPVFDDSWKQMPPGPLLSDGAWAERVAGRTCRRRRLPTLTRFLGPLAVGDGSRTTFLRHLLTAMQLRRIEPGG